MKREFSGSLHSYTAEASSGAHARHALGAVFFPLQAHTFFPVTPSMHSTVPISCGKKKKHLFGGRKALFRVRNTSVQPGTHKLHCSLLMREFGPSHLLVPTLSLVRSTGGPCQCLRARYGQKSLCCYLEAGMRHCQCSSWADMPQTPSVPAGVIPELSDTVL